MINNFQIVKKQNKFFVKYLTFLGWKFLKERRENQDIQKSISFKTDEEAKEFLSSYIVDNTLTVYPMKKVSVGTK